MGDQTTLAGVFELLANALRACVVIQITRFCEQISYQQVIDLNFD
jgi:hypothetical protein